VSRSTFEVQPTSSAVLIEARSTVGPIEIATTEVSGQACLTMVGDDLETAEEPAANLDLPVASLRSGTPLYDAEVHRRLDAQRYPSIRAELRSARSIANNRWAVSGDLTIHGTTRSMAGTAECTLMTSELLTVSGQQVIDIRDFDIVLPSALMLRIYPDVTVRYRIEALRTSTTETEAD
jgi:polyisoprenoid-binding protein YceI